MIELRPYQRSAVDFLTKTKRGILEAPASSGKTIMAAAAIAAILETREHVTPMQVEVMVYTKDLIEQWEEGLAEFPVIAEKAEVTIYCSASAPLETAPDILIVDECHRAAAVTWKRKIQTVSGVVWGLSATPFSGDDYRNTIIKTLFQDHVHVIKRDQLVARGHIAQARVVWHKVPCSDAPNKIAVLAEKLIAERKKKFPFRFSNPLYAKKEEGRTIWPIVEKFGLHEHEVRNRMIIDEANRRVRAGHSVIVLIHRVNHGQQLAKCISGAVLAHGRMGLKKRRETLQAFRDGKIRCLVATSLLDEGFDAPIADLIIIGVGGRSFRKAVQASGRVLRPFVGKLRGIIIDFADDSHGMLAAQARKRRDIYESMGYQQVGDLPSKKKSPLTPF